MLEDAFRAQRLRMVDEQLRLRGIRDESVLRVVGEVPRHLFLRPEQSAEAYADHPVPIGDGQTLSQPYMVARMVELCRLQAAARVLEIGAGSGYQTAVLARLCRQVHGIELRAKLLADARRTLAALGIDNVELREGDGSEGWPEQGPYDAIIVAAGASRVPAPLVEQLADGGRLVIPVGPRSVQTLHVLSRRGSAVEQAEDTACRFVELQGAYGWP